MWKDKHAVIFDMDGTLMDSMWMWYDIDVEYLTAHGIALPPKLQQDIEGTSFHELAYYFRDRFSLPDTPEEIMADWNRMALDKYKHEVPLKKGAREYLGVLRQAGIRTGIATSNSPELTHAALRANGVEEAFDRVQTSEPGMKGKPEPDIYLYLAKLWDIDPAQILVFEDVPNGALAAKRAGMEVCAVWDEQARDRQAEMREIADYFIRDFEELLAGRWEVLH